MRRRKGDSKDLRERVVSQGLTPSLKKGDIVFMDNLRIHRVDGVRQAIEAVGAIVRYRPARSPELNPVEQALSKLKPAMRKGAGPTVRHSGS